MFDRPFRIKPLTDSPRNFFRPIRNTATVLSEVKKMASEKTIKLSKGFVEYKDSTKEVCILNVDDTETRITEKMFEEIKKVMGWK